MPALRLGMLQIHCHASTCRCHQSVTCAPAGMTLTYSPKPKGRGSRRNKHCGSTTQALVEVLRPVASALASVPLSLAIVAASLVEPPSASAVLNSPNAQIPRTVDAALRRSIPARNSNVREVQSRMEDVAFKLRIPQRKPWQGMQENVTASQVIAGQQDKVPATCA